MSTLYDIAGFAAVVILVGRFLCAPIRPGLLLARGLPCGACFTASLEVLGSARQALPSPSGNVVFAFWSFFFSLRLTIPESFLSLGGSLLSKTPPVGGVLVLVSINGPTSIGERTSPCAELLHGRKVI